MKNKMKIGHIFALFTVVVWGTTFISTKVLLVDFSPIEILVYRFIIGYVALVIAYPKVLKIKEKKQEIVFILAGLCGVCLYYLLENIALTYTLASNVGVIISIAPFFTAIASHLWMKEEPLRVNFFIGFCIAIAGIVCISFNGSQLQVNPIGDVLSIIAAIVWACYSILTKKINYFGYHPIQATRRVFMYGILFMLPTLFFFDFSWDISRFSNTTHLLNILFLGLGASALCFVTWGIAVKYIGALKTSIYIYIVPVVTVVTSVLVLDEKITLLSGVGTILTLVGLVVSEFHWKEKGIRDSM